MTKSLGRRLGFGFAVIGVGTALLSALFVNVAFSNRFDSYLEQQRSARVQQITGAVTGVYESAGRWDGARLDELAPALAMAGAEVVLTDVGGRTIWSTDGSGSEMAEMHRSMTEAGPLTEPVSMPVTVDGRQRATLEVSLPEGSVPVADQ